MKGKTKMIAMAISLVVTVILIGFGWFAHGNPVTLYVGAFLVFVYFPIHFWDAKQRINMEKRQAEHEKDMARLRQATENFLKNYKD